jgi:hypothetical protein
MEVIRMGFVFLGVKIALSRTEVDHVGISVFFALPTVYLHCG